MILEPCNSQQFKTKHTLIIFDSFHASKKTASHRCIHPTQPDPFLLLWRKIELEPLQMILSSLKRSQTEQTGQQSLLVVISGQFVTLPVRSGSAKQIREASSHHSSSRSGSNSYPHGWFTLLTLIFNTNALDKVLFSLEPGNGSQLILVRWRVDWNNFQFDIFFSKWGIFYCLDLKLPDNFLSRKHLKVDRQGIELLQDWNGPSWNQNLKYYEMDSSWLCVSEKTIAGFPNRWPVDH